MDFTDIKLFFMVPVNATIFIKFDTLSGFESVCKDFISLIYVFVWPKKKKKIEYSILQRSDKFL